MLMLVIDIKKRNLIQICGNIVWILSVVLIFFFQDEILQYALISFCISKVILLISYLWSIGKIPKPMKVKCNVILKKVKFGYLPMFSLLLMTLNYKVDILMLKAEKSISMSDIGIYSVGVSVAELLWFIPDVFREVLFNKTANNDERDVISVIRVSNCIMVLIIFAEILFGKIFILIFYGEAYVNAYRVLLILLLGVPMMAWFKIIYTVFNAQGKRKLSFFLLTLSAILNIVLNSCDHPTAKMVYDKARCIIPNISLGTVYRNLGILSEMCQIRRIPMEDGNDRYDKTLVNHNHIYCEVCGRVCDIDNYMANMDYDKIKKMTGFKVTDSNFNIKGICQECIKERNY